MRIPNLVCTVVLALCSVLPAFSARAAYAFSLTGTTATVTGDATVSTLVIDQSGGVLRHSINGGAFSADWDDATAGVQSLPANGASVVTISVSSGDGSSVVWGTPTGAASTLLAEIIVVFPANTKDTMVLDDSASTIANTYVINTQPGFISGTGINYAEFSSTPVRGGITIKGALAASTFNIQTVYAAEPESFLGGPGSNTFNVCSTAPALTGILDSIQSTVTIDAGAGSNTLNLSDFASGTPNANVVVTNNSISGLAGGSDGTVINYAATGGSFGGGINLSGSNTSNDSFAIQGTPAGSNMTIYGNGGNQSYTFGNPAGKLDDLQGAIIINGGTGTNSLSFNDPNGSPGSVYTLTSSTCTRNGIATVTYGAIATLTLSTTTEQAVLNVNSIPAGTAVVLNNAETVNLGNAGSMQMILGNVTLNNTTSLINLILDDSGDTTARTVTLDSASILGLAPVPILFDAQQLVAVTLRGGSGGNTFNVVNTAKAVATAIQTGAGNDVVNVKEVSLTSTLDVDGKAGSDTLALATGTHTWNITGPNSGNIDSLITFENVESLIGGNGNDSFVFQAEGSLSGSINGGAGNATLDLSVFGPLTLTIPGAGTIHGYRGTVGGATPPLGQGFDNIDRLVATLAVSASGSPLTGIAPLPVAFTGGPTGATYSWNFGDGSAPSTAQSPMHTFAAGGTYNVVLTVSIGPLTGTASVTVTVSPMQTLSVTALGIKLNFAKPANDSVTLSGMLPVPAGLTVMGQVITVNVGGVGETFTLNAKGGTPKGNNTFTLTVKSGPGGVSQQVAKFAMVLTKGTFATTLATDGLANANLSAVPVSVPVTVTFNNEVFQKTVALTYTAKQGSSGVAK